MRYKVLVLIAVALAAPHLIMADGYRLDDPSIPLNARVEKVNSLLHTWSLESEELTRQFYLPREERVLAVQQVLDRLSSGTDSYQCNLSEDTKKHAKYTAARWALIDGLDLSEARLNHFFSINPGKYSCEPRANVSELFIPDGYLADRQTSVILQEIFTQLKTQPFGQAAYDITTRFGDPTTGYKGETSKAAVGEERFEFYQRAALQGGIGGPYQVPGGYLFVQVTSLLADEADCFDFYKKKVGEDYARLWLRKIFKDTVTTLTADARVTTYPVQMPVRLADPAFYADGSTVTLAEARALLPYVIGDAKNPKFWESVQQQALEIELLSRSSAAKAAENTEWYALIKNSLCAIRAAKYQLEKRLDTEVTTDSLRAWYNKNRYKFDTITTLTYTKYHCGAGYDPAECAAKLETLHLQDTISTEVIKARLKGRWEALPRELQAVTQKLNPGEWSEVFALNNSPCRIHLHEKNVISIPFEEIAGTLKIEYVTDFRHAFWQNFAALEPGSKQSVGVK